MHHQSIPLTWPDPFSRLNIKEKVVWLVRLTYIICRTYTIHMNHVTSLVKWTLSTISHWLTQHSKTSYTRIGTLVVDRLLCHVIPVFLMNAWWFTGLIVYCYINTLKLEWGKETIPVLNILVHMSMLYLLYEVADRVPRYISAACLMFIWYKPTQYNRLLYSAYEWKYFTGPGKVLQLQIKTRIP